MSKEDEKTLERLERYEKHAYDGGYGADWLESIGEELSRYFRHCCKTGERATMAGFVSRIDEFAMEVVTE